MFPDNPWFLLPKFADESCGRIWKFPKELSDLGGGGWNELKTDGGGWRGGGGGGGMNGPGQGIDGGDGGGERLLFLLLLFFGSVSTSLNLSDRFWIAKSCQGGPGAFFTRSLATTFFPTSSSVRSELTIGFSASIVELSSKTSSKGFCHL